MLTKPDEKPIDLVRVEKKVIQGKRGNFVQYTVYVGQHKVLFVSDFPNKIVVKTLRPLRVPEEGFTLLRVYEKI